MVIPSPQRKGETMNWLAPAKIQPTGDDLEANALGFIQKYGQIGQIALEAWNAVDPLHCFHAPDEYLGYARRFIEGATSVSPVTSEWSTSLVEELVRRSFRPSQVCIHSGLNAPWATMESIKAISQLIIERVEQLGGMDKLLIET